MVVVGREDSRVSYDQNDETLSRMVVVGREEKPVA